jgi:putative flavoprotein involved in K+ transport
MAVFPGLDSESLDALVIGGGQAGLAAAWHLKRMGLRFLVVDAAVRVGHRWQTRYDSLRLFTPAEYNSLPGLPFPAPAGTYPTKDEVADYLDDYAQTFELPMRLGTRVTSLRRSEEGFVAVTDRGTLTARQVVVATGACASPYVPEDLAAGLGAEVVQLHSARYRSVADLPDGPVLVVGAGNSGVQIAVEVARTGRPVSLAVGAQSHTVPQKLLGRDLSWWLIRFGLATLPGEIGPAPAPGAGKIVIDRVWRRLRALAGTLRTHGESASGAGIQVIIGTSWRRVRGSGVTLRPRAVTGSGSTVGFANGESLDVAAVIWATGYRPDYSWLEVPGVVVDGRVRHTGGMTAVPGLVFLGLVGQRSRTSEWLGFVADDAAWLVERLQESSHADVAVVPRGLPDPPSVSGPRPLSPPSASGPVGANVR